MNNVKIVRTSILKIYINGFLHVYFNPLKSFHFQSWIEDIKRVEMFYVIEFYVDGKAIRTEYDNKELWLAILVELDKVFVS